LGTPAITTRGMGKNEMKKIALWINQVTKILIDIKNTEDRKELKRLLKSNPELKKIGKNVTAMCHRFEIQK
ncbi:hypothetical protein KAZ57_03255, partial [Patescibacteria group bacterium]|nr:hypothetical protein [Patescibacteria group bacterium]